MHSPGVKGCFWFEAFGAESISTRERFEEFVWSFFALDAIGFWSFWSASVAQQSE